MSNPLSRLCWDYGDRTWLWVSVVRLNKVENQGKKGPVLCLTSLWRTKHLWYHHWRGEEAHKKKKRFGWQHGLLSTKLACVITSKEPFILLYIKQEQATVLCPLPLTKRNMTPECCTTGISCFCLPAFVETRVGRIKNDSWHLCNAVWQNLVLCLLFCRGSGPYRLFSDGNPHIKTSLIYVRFMNGNIPAWSLSLFDFTRWRCLSTLLLLCCACVRAYLRKLGSIWASSWMSSASLWAILMANSLSLLSCSNMACVWVSSSRSNASCISSSAWNNIHSHKSIIRTHNLNIFGVYHTCAFVLFQLDGNTETWI